MRDDGLSFFDLAQLNNQDGDLYSEYVELESKVVREDPYLIGMNLFSGLSAHSSTQIHTIINAPSSEGKTYPILQCCSYFPKKLTLVLGSATPQTFKYEYGVLVDKNFRPLDPVLKKIDEGMETAKNAKLMDIYEELEIRRKQLLKNSMYLVDLRNKWIIFKDPPPQKLLEALYSTLSADEEYSIQKFVDTTRKGGNKTFTVVFHGTPAMTICSTKDHTQNSRWEETFTRFNIISPKSSPKKYLEGMQLIAQSNGLPKSLLEENVLNLDEKNRIKTLVAKFIGKIRQHNGETFNSFQDKLAEKFPQESGYRWRQFKRFNAILKLRTLIYSHERPYLALDKRKRIPVTILSDLIWTLKFVKENDFVPPYKIKWFKEIFLKAYEAKKTKVGFPTPDEFEHYYVVIISDIVNYLKEKGIPVKSTKQLRESYLVTLHEHGFVEKARDPRNSTREVYWPTELGVSGSESTLIAVSSFNEACVKSCLEKYLQRRFYFTFKGKVYDQDEIVNLIMCKDSLLSKSQNVIQAGNFVPKISNGDLTVVN